MEMTLESIQQRIEALALKVFAENGMDLIEIKVAGSKNDVLIQITADKPSGGINIHECAILNKSLVAAIEQENVLPPEIFSLELSSPGLDRPLVTRKDFMRVIGSELHFWLHEAVGSKKKKEIEGLLEAVEGTTLTVMTKSKERITLPLPSIIKGMLVI